jgi:hypothetical protein
MQKQEEGKLTVAGFELSGEELIIKKEFKGDTAIYQARLSSVVIYIYICIYIYLC